MLFSVVEVINILVLNVSVLSVASNFVADIKNWHLSDTIFCSGTLQFHLQ